MERANDTLNIPVTEEAAATKDLSAAEHPTLCVLRKLVLVLLIVFGVRRYRAGNALASANNEGIHLRFHSIPGNGSGSSSPPHRCYLASSEGHWNLTGNPKSFFYVRNRTCFQGSSCIPVHDTKNASSSPTPSTIEAVRQCLANRHLMFVGDSVSRFQAFVLIRYLQTGEWPIQHPRVRTLCYHGAWATGRLRGPGLTEMDHFMVAMYDILGGNASEYYSSWNHTFPRENFYDHEIVRFPGPMNFTISFLSWLGDVPLQGMWLNVTFENSSRMARRDFQHESDYCLHYPSSCWKAANISEAMERYIPELRPTDLFLNSGIWIHTGFSQPFTNHTLESISQAGRRLFTTLSRQSHPEIPSSPTNKEPPVRLFWKTTTAVSDNISEKGRNASDFTDPIPKRWFQRSGWGIFDAGEMTRGLPPTRIFYADYVHYQCLVYRELNKYLLDLLCH